jgi:hypothetical protein
MLMKNRVPDPPAQRRQKGAPSQLEVTGEAEVPRLLVGPAEGPMQQGCDAPLPPFHHMDNPEASPEAYDFDEDD